MAIAMFQLSGLVAGNPGMAMNAAGSVYDTSTSPPLVSQGATGAISGGILRPGSIDQGAFVQALQQAQQNRAAAGVGGKPV